jgi:hypothetical protein
VSVARATQKGRLTTGQRPNLETDNPRALHHPQNLFLENYFVFISKQFNLICLKTSSLLIEFSCPRNDFAQTAVKIAVPRGRGRDAFRMMKRGTCRDRTLGIRERHTLETDFW